MYHATAVRPNRAATAGGSPPPRGKTWVALIARCILFSALSYASALVIIVVICDNAGTRPVETTFSSMTMPGVPITP